MIQSPIVALILSGLIRRRILVNYQVDPAVMRSILPAPFRPKLVKGIAIAGICLIRLERIKPSVLPGNWGLSSENVAHRIAVEWDEDGSLRQGVFIPRRDSSSWLNTLVADRLFPLTHHHARFDTWQQADRVRVAFSSDDGQSRVSVQGQIVDHLPATSIFASLAEASAFFAGGAVGYSLTKQAGRYDGIELRTHGWNIEPWYVESRQSSFLEDRSLFTAGSTRVDCARIIRIE